MPNTDKAVFARGGSSKAPIRQLDGLLRHAWTGRLALLAVRLATVGLAAGCSTLPPIEGRTESSALADTADTRLGRAIASQVAAHPGMSGIHPLADPLDAFAARALLADAAERSIDVQYYIWQGDISGLLLLDRLRAAAERGVRVRMLLDDNGTSGLDAILAAFDRHPGIEVRLFNPFANRTSRLAGYLGDFRRANRRMHNKSFTVDNQATIVGGRNIGDAYFAAGTGPVYADLDVLAVGPITAEVSTDFDRYWASGSSYPVAWLLPAAEPDALAGFAAEAKQLRESPAARDYRERLASSSLVKSLAGGALDLTWAPTRMVSDDPAKGLGEVKREDSMAAQLAEAIGEPQRRLDLVSAYFVPTDAGVDAFTRMASRGVSVTILTNALEATDVAVVHAGYAKHRRRLLAGGVSLYEMRRLSPKGLEKAIGSSGSSASSLHAKTFLVDEERLFVGSFNFDPRSIHLNTELGFVIASATLTKAIQSSIARRLPEIAWRVELGEDGELRWVSGLPGEGRRDTEPGASAWRRLGVWLLSWLPIDWML
jgi:putative cardiolipin synthase